MQSFRDPDLPAQSLFGAGQEERTREHKATLLAQPREDNSYHFGLYYIGGEKSQAQTQYKGLKKHS